jgi:hypothetical protein
MSIPRSFRPHAPAANARISTVFSPIGVLETTTSSGWPGLFQHIHVLPPEQSNVLSRLLIVISRRNWLNVDWSTKQNWWVRNGNSRKSRHCWSIRWLHWSKQDGLIGLRRAGSARYTLDGLMLLCFSGPNAPRTRCTEKHQSGHFISAMDDRALPARKFVEIWVSFSGEEQGNCRERWLQGMSREDNVTNDSIQTIPIEVERCCSQNHINENQRTRLKRISRSGWTDSEHRIRSFLIISRITSHHFSHYARALIEENASFNLASWRRRKRRWFGSFVGILGKFNPADIVIA